MRKFFQFLFILFVSAATLELISMEEILGKKNVEITSDTDLEISSKEEKKESSTGFDFFPLSSRLLSFEPGIVFTSFCRFVFRPAFIVPTGKTPIYLLFCQLKINS
ncbi:MAG: hypothetical protein OEY56_02330 [Cyclobacteriaceae bacterium]|nr:hypothetical protein [Cyclobacteriaceae bacterium]